MNNKGSNNKIRVLMLGPDRNVHGGISAVVNGYYEAGLNTKVELKYISTMKEGSKAYKLLIAIGAYLRFLLALKGIEIVHVNVASDNSFRRKAIFINRAKKAGKKVVIHQHGGEWNCYYNSLKKHRKDETCKTLGMADKFLVLSPYYKEFFEKVIGIKEVIVFPDTIKIPSKPNKKITGKRILFLGRLCKEKGIWEDKELSKLIENYEFIKYLGWVTSEAKNMILAQTDVFVMPSYFEGQSLAILEAMAMNCAIIATNVGGIPMMIEDGVTGILIEPKDTNGLYNGLESIFENPILASNLANNAYDKVKDCFDIQKTVNEIVSIYEELVNV